MLRRLPEMHRPSDISGAVQVLRPGVQQEHALGGQTGGGFFLRLVVDDGSVRRKSSNRTIYRYINTGQ